MRTAEPGVLSMEKAYEVELSIRENAIITIKHSDEKIIDAMVDRFRTQFVGKIKEIEVEMVCENCYKPFKTTENITICPDCRGM